MRTLLQDLRFGARMLAKHPGFTAVALLTLTTGIGACTTIFSAVNAVLLQRFPFSGADRLVMIAQTDERGRPSGVAPPTFSSWREQVTVFEQIAAKTDWSGYDLTGREEPEQVIGVPVSASMFPLLQAQPLLGRTFLPEEDRAGGRPVVLLSYRLWLRRFKGDSEIVGQSLKLNGQPHTIIGVMRPGFYLNREAALRSETDELWVPLARELGTEGLSDRSARNLRVWARLKPGATVEQARAEMQMIQRRLERPIGASDEGVTVFWLSEWGAQRVKRVHGWLAVFTGAGLFVLLIACANVANLRLASGGERVKEIVIRMALGASRLRVIRQLLAESILFAGVAGLLGTLLAFWGVRALAAVLPENIRIPGLHLIAIDRPVLAFAVLVSLASGILSGLAPALQASRRRAAAGLNHALTEPGSSAEGRYGRRFRGALVVAELALALMLLAGAGLLIRSVRVLQAIDPGLRSDGVLAVQIPAPDRPPNLTRQDIQKREAFLAGVLERVAGLPGVQSVGIADRLPLAASVKRTRLAVEGAPATPLRATSRVVSAGYFRTLGIPLQRGRYLNEYDTRQAPGAAVINETLARRYWPGRDPLGKRIRPDEPETDIPWFSIVGVVANAKNNELTSEANPEIYWSYLQVDSYSMATTLVLRSEGDPLALANPVRTEVHRLNKDQPIPDIRTMSDVISKSIAPQQFNMFLLGVLASIALVLAAAGTYSVISCTVVQRTREIGVRMALGARPTDVLRNVVGHGAKLALGGVAVGLASAWMLTRTLAAFLYGVAPTDPLTFLLVSLLLLAIALLASFIPARRAARVDPAVALRYE